MDDRLTRRRLIQVGGGAAAILYFGGLTGLAVADPGAPAFLRRSSYAGLVGSAFTARAPDGGTVPLTLTLAGVSDLERAREEPAFVGRDDAFGLLFSGPAAGEPLRSAIHELAQASLGSFAVFITPVGALSGTQTYELVVDRSVSLGAAAKLAPSPLADSNTAGVVAVAAPASTPGASASASASAPAATAVAATERLVESATIARRGGVMTVDVRVGRGRGIVSVRATLFRGRVEYARAGRLLGGHLGTRLHLREVRPVAPGHYDLHITTTDHRGRHVLTEKRVVLR